MIATLLLAIISVALFYSLTISNYSEFNLAGVTGSSGRIDEGERFRVKIGAEYGEVKRIMEGLGFEKRDLTKPNSCHGFTYPEELTPQLWFDNSWRKGTLCVITSRDKVAYLSWSYGIGFP